MTPYTRRLPARDLRPGMSLVEPDGYLLPVTAVVRLDTGLIRLECKGINGPTRTEVRPDRAATVFDPQAA